MAESDNLQSVDEAASLSSWIGFPKEFSVKNGDPAGNRTRCSQGNTCGQAQVGETFRQRSGRNGRSLALRGNTTEGRFSTDGSQGIHGAGRRGEFCLRRPERVGDAQSGDVLEVFLVAGYQWQAMASAVPAMMASARAILFFWRSAIACVMTSASSGGTVSR